MLKMLSLFGIRDNIYSDGRTHLTAYVNNRLCGITYISRFNRQNKEKVLFHQESVIELMQIIDGLIFCTSFGGG